MELAWIDDFNALCETGNFTMAARRRNTTQPAYSRRIQRLEDWIGAPLFNRETRPVTLTPSGIEFAKRAPRIREDIMDMRRIAGSVATRLHNATRIFTTNTIAIGMMPNWIAANNIDHYSLTVSSVSNCIDAVRQQKCDMALIPVFPDTDIPADLQVETTYTDRLSFFIRRDKADDITVKNTIIHGPVMMYAPVTAYGHLIAREMRKRGLSLADKPVCESASAEALLAQVKHGAGGAWIPHSIIDDLSPIASMPAITAIDFDIALIRPLTHLQSKTDSL